MDNCFPESLLIPLMLICGLCVFKGKGLFVNDRTNVVRIDAFVHVLELDPGSNHDTTDDANVDQGIESARLRLSLDAAQKADHADDAFGFDSFHRLRHAARATNLNYVVDALLTRR